VPGVDVVVVLQLARQGDQEPDVVDVVTVGGRRPAPVGPALVVSVGIGHQQLMGVGDAVEVGQPPLPGSAPAAAVQAEHEPDGIAGRHVQRVRPVHAAGTQRARNIARAGRVDMPHAAPGQANRHKGRQSQRRPPRVRHGRQATDAEFAARFRAAPLTCVSLL
jgi:hypothetical protein